MKKSELQNRKEDSEMRELGKKIPLLFGIVSLAVMFTGLYLIPLKGYYQGALLRFALAAVMVLILWPALGKRWLEIPCGGWKTTFQLTKGILIGTAVLVLIMFAATMLVPAMAEMSEELAQEMGTDSEMELNENWFSNLMGIALLCISVGIVEELAFRRGLFGCALEQFPKMKNNVLWMAVISSVLFGFAHVAGSLSSDFVGIVSTALKTIQSGMIGFIFCAALMEGESMWPIAAAHALFDFISLATQAFFGTGEYGQYVLTSEDGVTAIAAVVTYSVFVLICLPATIRAFRILKEQEYLPFHPD